MPLRIYSECDHQPEEHLLGQFIPLHYHFNMLQDKERVEAFRSAIEVAVRPGMKVLELGGGTGILSFFAARQGASVWCVERNTELARTARQLLKRNKVHDRVEVIESDAEEFVPPEPVDVVICEMLHVAMLREKQLDVIASFKDRYVRRHGDILPQFIPDSSILMVQPVEHAFDFAGYHAPIPLFQAPTSHQDQTFSLSELIPYASVFYNQEFPCYFNWAGDIRIVRSGTVTALRFVTHNLLGFRPPQTPIPWSNQFLVVPLEGPVPVVSGQTIGVRFEYASGEPLAVLSDSISVDANTGVASLRRAA